MAVDPEAADHEPLEVAGEEVRQPERRRLLVGQRGRSRRGRRRTRSSGRRAGARRPPRRGPARAGRRCRSRRRRRRSARSPRARASRIRARTAPGCRRAGCGGRAAGRRRRRSGSGRVSSTSSRASAPQPMTSDAVGRPRLVRLADQRANGGRASARFGPRPPSIGPPAGPFGGRLVEPRARSFLGPPGGPRHEGRRGATRLRPRHDARR